MKNNKYLVVTLKLTLITALSALLIGIVFFATEDRIARARAAATNAAILEVFPEFNDANSRELPTNEIINRSYIDSVRIIHNSSNEYIGKAFIASAPTGRSTHTISLVIGIFDNEVVGHSEIRFEQSDSTFLGRVRRNLERILPGATSDDIPGITMEAGSTEGTSTLLHLFNIAFLEYAGAELDLNDEETAAIEAIFPTFNRANSNVDFTSTNVITAILPHNDGLSINRYIEARNADNELIGHVVIARAVNNWGHVNLAIGLSHDTPNMAAGSGGGSPQHTLVGLELISISQSQWGEGSYTNPANNQNRHHTLLTLELIIEIQNMIDSTATILLRDILSLNPATGGNQTISIAELEARMTAAEDHFENRGLNFNFDRPETGTFPGANDSEVTIGADGNITIAGATRGRTLVIAAIDAAFTEVLIRTR